MSFCPGKQIHLIRNGQILCFPYVTAVYLSMQLVRKVMVKHHLRLIPYRRQITQKQIAVNGMRPHVGCFDGRQTGIVHVGLDGAHIVQHTNQRPFRQLSIAVFAFHLQHIAKNITDNLTVIQKPCIHGAHSAADNLIYVKSTYEFRPHALPPITFSLLCGSL